jgi:hypothetical protein
MKLENEIRRKTFQMPCSLVKIPVGQVNPRNLKILKLNVSNSLVTHVEKLATWPRIADRNSSNQKIQKRNPQNQPERQKSL